MTTTIINDPPTVAAQSGEPMEQQMENLTIPARYEVLSQVGTGGMGIVYKVRDQETHDIIALKLLKAGIAADPAMQENLRREVSLARKVTHKNVCRIHEFNRSNGTACISMEFVEGESLLAKLQRDGRLPWTDARKVAWQICAGLREAHAQGIVHRDLKPANIMVDDNGGVKIMDFGIARLLCQGTSQMTGTLVGTPAYMAPEQVELKRVDARTDIYALGLLLYEVVTGMPAFQGDSPIAVALKQLRDTPQRPRDIVTTLPAGAQALIMKCLQKNPDKRFQSVDELAAALQREATPRPAVSMWASFCADFRRAGRDLRENLRPAIAASVNFVQKQNWKALQSKQTLVMAGSGLAVACLVGGLIVSPVRSSRQKQASGAATAAALQAKATQSSVPAAFSARATSPISAFDVDLSRNGQAAPESAPALQIVDASEVKAHEVARRAAPSPKPSQKKPAQQSTVVPAAPVASAVESNEAKAEEETPALSAAVYADAPAAEPVVAAKEEKTAVDNPAAGRFFEVGSFKDAAWADHAVDQLTELGFHAASVHKGMLWMHSYQVRVGPYMDSKSLEAARLDLIARGFKPHSVK